MILIVVLLIILILLAYFGRAFWVEKTILQSNILKNDVISPDSKVANSEGIEEKTIRNLLLSAENHLEEEPKSEIDLQNPEEKLKIVLDLPEEMLPAELKPIPNIESEIVSLEEEDMSQKTPEGSPKSTSSCISLEILTDSLIEEDGELSGIQTTGNEDCSLTSRPCSFPLDFSTSSSPPYFNFTRKTPELVPRMMLEEFELLDKSIEKRKIGIRDLLKRIESAKRRHRRFSEHIQRVQREHHIDY